MKTSREWKVIATMRNLENETELTKPKNVTVVKLDVADPEQISEVVNQVTAEHSVDVVLNNADYGLVGVLEWSLQGIFQRDNWGHVRRNI